MGAERTFDRLREQNRGGEPWSFIDGPITANNPMGVHHAWGRTLKDVFQRYKALRGYDQRYQNGFDCQGLWVEVEVEKALGLNSKREIEEYGLAEFAERCKERVAAFSERDRRAVPTARACGWTGRTSYYTFSDTNIEYIWRFLKEVERARAGCTRATARRSGARAAARRSPSTSRPARRTTRSSSIPSLYVRFPLKGRDGEALVVWTTTPWTLPANVAAAVKPDAEYGLRDDGGWLARELAGEGEFAKTAPGRGAGRPRVRRAVRRPARRSRGSSTA